MNIVEEIKEISDKLDEIDNYNSGLGQQLSIIDKKQQDILHYVENNKLSAFGCYRLFKELKKVRLIRRKIKNDMELSKIYLEQKNKLLSTENRKFLLQTLYKKENSLDSEYKMQEYKEEELEAIIK